MKTATVRDLKHDFSKIESWIHQGEKVQISKRGTPFMEISPLKKVKKGGHHSEAINFQEVQERLWKDRRFFSPEEIDQMLQMTEDEGI